MIQEHELGHLLVAKRVGITVYTFAIGFGPRLGAFTLGETTYALNALPIGGYVHMAGEDLDSRQAEVPPERSFRTKSVAQRLAVVCAGPVMNFLLAIVLLAAIAGAFGIPVGVSTRVGTLLPGYPAAAAGLRPGDVILAIDDQPMKDGETIVQTIHSSGARRPAAIRAAPGRAQRAGHGGERARSGGARRGGNLPLYHGVLQHHHRVVQPLSPPRPRRRTGGVPRRGGAVEAAGGSAPRRVHSPGRVRAAAVPDHRAHDPGFPPPGASPAPVMLQ